MLNFPIPVSRLPNPKDRLLSRRGYTLIELLLVVSLLAFLLVLGGIFFSNFVRQDQVLSEAGKVQNLIQEAQTRTLAGYTLGGGSALSFGLHFEEDRYVLFPGEVYDPADSRNQIFSLPADWRFFPIFLPQNNLLFARVTGEIANFDPDQNYVVLADERSTQTIKISLNQLGVVSFSEP